MKAPQENTLPEEVCRVLSILKERDIPFQLQYLEQAAHHASQAASILGCEIGAVVKALIFKSTQDDKFIQVLVSGKNRVDLAILAELTGYTMKTANPQTVLDHTGYPVGAVPPFGLPGEFPVIIDEDLLEHAQVWASAGSAYVLVGFAPEILIEIIPCHVRAIHK